MKKLFCRQPKLLIVIELKLAEILGVCVIVGILYGSGLALNSVWYRGIDTKLEIFTKGILVYLCISVLYLISFGIYHAIKANWAWAERLKNKHKYP
ncbi:hypothetical protein LCGC14_1730530 [marine sediment metagenome]|uniref:Uncharacterized protein n=1 Tax=marine sediment metagenome TaxID=412755 RepID=A0A0F9JQB7_9ZZZZ